MKRSILLAGLLAAGTFPLVAGPGGIAPERAVAVYEFMGGPLPQTTQLHVIHSEEAAGHGFISYLQFPEMEGPVRLHLYAESADPGSRLVVRPLKRPLPEQPKWAERPEAGGWQRAVMVGKGGQWIVVELPGAGSLELSGEGRLAFSATGERAPWIEAVSGPE